MKNYYGIHEKSRTKEYNKYQKEITQMDLTAD